MQTTYMNSVLILLTEALLLAHIYMYILYNVLAMRSHMDLNIYRISLFSQTTEYYGKE